MATAAQLIAARLPHPTDSLRAHGLPNHEIHGKDPIHRLSHLTTRFADPHTAPAWQWPRNAEHWGLLEKWPTANQPLTPVSPELILGLSDDGEEDEDEVVKHYPAFMYTHPQAPGCSSQKLIWSWEVDPATLVATFDACWGCEGRIEQGGTDGRRDCLPKGATIDFSRDLADPKRLILLRPEVGPPVDDEDDSQDEGDDEDSQVGDDGGDDGSYEPSSIDDGTPEEASVSTETEESAQKTATTEVELAMSRPSLGSSENAPPRLKRFRHRRDSETHIEAGYGSDSTQGRQGKRPARVDPDESEQEAAVSISTPKGNRARRRIMSEEPDDQGLDVEVDNAAQQVAGPSGQSSADGI